MEQQIRDTLGTILTTLGIAFTDILIRKEGDIIRTEVVSAEASKLIGWHGETLNSVQHLLKSCIRSIEKLERAPFIVLDVDGYRVMQEEKVRTIAEQKAEFVRRTGSRVTLSPMSPYFRRIVHLHIANTPTLTDLATESVGEGDYRQVVIRLKNEKKIDSGEELSPVIAQSDGLENLDI